MPTLTIITVSLNSRNVIDSCLESIRRQNVGAQHIWIDGGSTDGTVSHLRKYTGHKLEMVVEPDDGIYDAMNKGLSMASGEIVGILNADDYYPSNHVLEKVVEIFRNPEIDACYGDLKYVDANNIERIVRHWRAGHYKRSSYYWGWMPPHPTLFVRRSVYSRFGEYNLKLGTSADYEMMLRLMLKNQIRVAYIPEVLVHMRVGGASNSNLANRIRAHAMDYKAWHVNGLRPYPWTLPLKPLRKIGQWLFK